MTEEEIANSDNTQKRIVYQHKIEPGITKMEHYGLALASKTNLPEDTVKLAKELAELIVKNKKVSCIFLNLVGSLILRAFDKNSFRTKQNPKLLEQQDTEIFLN